MSQAITIARPYACALYEIANKLQSEAAWLDDLENFKLIAQDLAVKELLINPNVSKDMRVQLFAKLVDNVSKELSSFLQILADKNRLIILPEIVDLYREIFNKKNKKVMVNLQTAHPVNDSFLEDLKQVLQTHCQSEICLTVEVDQSLIGGGILRFHDKVIDASLANKIKQLAHSLVN